MSIIYRPNAHYCTPPREAKARNPRGTIWRCDDCGEYRVSDGNGRWVLPFPWGPTARRIKRLQNGGQR